MAITQEQLTASMQQTLAAGRPVVVSSPPIQSPLPTQSQYQKPSLSTPPTPPPTFTQSQQYTSPSQSSFKPTSIYGSEYSAQRQEQLLKQQELERQRRSEILQFKGLASPSGFEIPKQDLEKIRTEANRIAERERIIEQGTTPAAVGLTKVAGGAVLMATPLAPVGAFVVGSGVSDLTRTKSAQRLQEKIKPVTEGIYNIHLANQREEYEKRKEMIQQGGEGYYGYSPFDKAINANLTYDEFLQKKEYQPLQYRAFEGIGKRVAKYPVESAGTVLSLKFGLKTAKGVGDTIIKGLSPYTSYVENKLLGKFISSPQTYNFLQRAGYGVVGAIAKLPPVFIEYGSQKKLAELQTQTTLHPESIGLLKEYDTNYNEVNKMTEKANTDMQLYTTSQYGFKNPVLNTYVPTPKQAFYTVFPSASTDVDKFRESFIAQGKEKGWSDEKIQDMLYVAEQDILPDMQAWTSFRYAKPEAKANVEVGRGLKEMAVKYGIIKEGGELTKEAYLKLISKYGKEVGRRYILPSTEEGGVTYNVAVDQFGISKEDIQKGSFNTWQDKLYAATMFKGYAPGIITTEGTKAYSSFEDKNIPTIKMSGTEKEYFDMLGQNKFPQGKNVEYFVTDSTKKNEKGQRIDSYMVGWNVPESKPQKIFVAGRVLGTVPMSLITGVSGQMFNVGAEQPILKWGSKGRGGIVGSSRISRPIISEKSISPDLPDVYQRFSEKPVRASEKSIKPSTLRSSTARVIGEFADPISEGLGDVLTSVENRIRVKTFSPSISYSGSSSQSLSQSMGITQSQALTQSQSQALSQAQSQAMGQAQAQAQAKSQAQALSQALSQSQAQAESESQAESQAQSQSQAITSAIPFGFPSGFGGGDAGRWGYPRRGRQWIYKNPLADFATPFFMKKNMEMSMPVIGKKKDLSKFI